MSIPKSKVKIWHGACGRWWVGTYSKLGILPLIPIGTRDSFEEALILARQVWHKWCA